MAVMVVRQPAWTTVPHRVLAAAQVERQVLPVQPVHRGAHPHVRRPAPIPAWPHRQEAAVRIVLTNAPMAVHQPAPVIALQVVPRRVRQPVPTLVRRRPHRDAPLVLLTAVAAVLLDVPAAVVAVVLQVAAAAAAAAAAVAAHPVVAVSVIIHVRLAAVDHAIENVADHVVAHALAVAQHSVYQAAKVDAQERATVHAHHLARRRVAMDVIRPADPMANTKEKPLSYLFCEVR